MNKERAREELRDRKILAEIEYNQSEDAKKKDNLLRYIKALDLAINCTGAIEQIKAERDIAIQQLNELGYQFGEKIWKEFDVDNEGLEDHYFYLVAHKDYGIPMTAKWHQDCLPTFQVYIGGGKCDEYIDELENREDKKITHWCKLPNLPKADKE